MLIFLSRTLSVLLLFVAFASHAGIDVYPLRTTLNQGEQEATITVHNPENAPLILIQVWASPHETLGAEEPSKAVPIQVSPPMFRLEPGSSQLVRVIYSGPVTPDEQFYRLNVQEIPTATEAAHSVQFSFRHVLPLSVVPAGSQPGDLAKAIQSLRISPDGKDVQLSNPSNRVLIFDRVALNDSALPLDSNNQFTLAPHASRTLKLSTPLPPQGTFQFRWLDSYHVPQTASAPFPTP